jgi:hypothetical protein
VNDYLKGDALWNENKLYKAHSALGNAERTASPWTAKERSRAH